MFPRVYFYFRYMRVDIYFPWHLEKIKSSKESAVCENFLIYNNIPSFDDFTIFTHELNKYIFVIKKPDSLTH